MNQPTQTLREIIRMSQDPTVDMRSLRAKILTEPELTDRIVRYVRTFFRRVGELQDPARGIAVLGPRVCGYVAVQHVMVEGLANSRFPPSLMSNFWSDCIHRAVAARLLADYVDGVQRDIAFSVGLCAEWGMASLLDRQPDFVPWMREVRCALGDERLEAERDIFGRTHAAAFVRTGRAWEFPPELLTVIGSSHLSLKSSVEGETRSLIELVKSCDVLGEAFTSVSPGRELRAWVEDVGEAFEVPEDKAWLLAERVLKFTPMVGKALGVDVCEQPDITDLRDCVSTQPSSSTAVSPEAALVRVLQEENEALRKLNSLLRLEIDQGRDLDPVTNLPGHNRFIDLLGLEVKGARLDGRPLSLVLVDLDHFAALNARHGHRVGDMLLARVAQVLARLAQGSEGIARVGPDSFGLLLPCGDRKARIIAERIRAAIDAVVIDMDAGRVRTTARVVGVSLDQLPANATHEQFYHSAHQLIAQRSPDNRTYWRDAGR